MLSYLLQITCKDKSLLLFSKSKMEAHNWFNCIRDAIRLDRQIKFRLFRWGENDYFITVWDVVYKDKFYFDF